SGVLNELAEVGEVRVAGLGVLVPVDAIIPKLRLALTRPVVDGRLLRVLKLRVVARVDHRRRALRNADEAAGTRRSGVAALQRGHFHGRVLAALVRRGHVDPVGPRLRDLHESGEYPPVEVTA